MIPRDEINDEHPRNVIFKNTILSRVDVSRINEILRHDKSLSRICNMHDRQVLNPAAHYDCIY